MAICVRDAVENEMSRVLAMVLMSGSDHSQVTVSGFLSYLAAQRLELKCPKVIEDEKSGKLLGAMISVQSPGKTSMLIPSPCPPERNIIDAFVVAVEQLANTAQHEGLTILQALLAPGSSSHSIILGRAGFQYLADLRYMLLAVYGSTPCSATLDWIVIGDTHADDLRFVLRRTYEGSLDCPKLIGLRDVDDIIAGHRATGIHHPDLWFLARREGQDVGVLLLTEVPGRPALEVAYVGVVPEFRGQHLGKEMICHAINKTFEHDLPFLTLAVDHDNHPAMEMYRSFGFSETERRDAWILKLSK